MFKKTFLCLALVFPISVWASTPSQNLVALLSPIKTLIAQFKQQSQLSGGQYKMSEGELWLARPNRFRWQLIKPNRQLYVSNGKILWSYEPELEQATKQTLSSDLSSSVLGVLTSSPTNLTQHYRVTQSANNTFLLQPKQAQSSLIRSILIKFSGKVLSHIGIESQTGQVTEVGLFDVKINQKIAQSQFEYTPPAGISVLNNN